MNVHLGQMHAASFETDPKHLGFVLRRYHFVARMLRGAKEVIEIGSGDGTGANIVRPAVGMLVLSDAEPQQHLTVKWNPVDGKCPGPQLGRFDAAYSLDVLEHVAPTDEDKFFRNIIATLKPHGTVIIGSPSLESQPYASELSRRYHVNCKTGQQMCETLSRHFRNVFLFGMNDYALNDGFDQMCHYRIALCTGARDR